MFKLDDATAVDLICYNYDEEEWEDVEFGDAGYTRNYLVTCYRVFRYKPENTYWVITYECSYSYGGDDYSISYYEAQPVERTKIVKQWKPVEDMKE